MISITDTIAISEDEIHESFVRSSGPGGQHVNKTSTGVQLRFNVFESPSLPSDVRRRLIELAGSRVTTQGDLLIEASRHRSRERNRQDATDRLVKLIQQAAKPPVPRRKSRVSATQKRNRLDKKRRQSRTKALRKPPSGSED